MHPPRLFRREWPLALAILLMVGSSPIPGASNDAPVTPAAELDRMVETLHHVEQQIADAPSLEGALVALTALGSDLDVFELRFGVQPQHEAGWSKLTAQAKEMLPRFRKLMRRGPYFNADSAATAYGILLELSGQPRKALAQLDQIQPGGDCGNWQATVLMSVEDRKAGIIQRLGDYAAARKHLEAALSYLGLALYNPRPDLLITRYAFLLERTGDDAKAIANYQLVVDLNPNTTGAELSRAALLRHDALIEPTAERICRLYLDVDDRSNRDAAIFALAGHKFAESFAILTTRLRTANSWERNRLIPALGMLGDPAALPILRDIVQAADDNPNCLHALRALHALGDDTEIVPFLQHMSGRQDGLGIELEWFDGILREIYDAGPELQVDWNTKSEDFTATWLDWIAARQPPTSAAP